MFFCLEFAVLTSCTSKAVGIPDASWRQLTLLPLVIAVLPLEMFQWIIYCTFLIRGALYNKANTLVPLPFQE